MKGNTGKEKKKQRGKTWQVMKKGQQAFDPQHLQKLETVVFIVFVVSFICRVFACGFPPNFCVFETASSKLKEPNTKTENTGEICCGIWDNQSKKWESIFFDIAEMSRESNKHECFIEKDLKTYEIIIEHEKHDT